MRCSVIALLLLALLPAPAAAISLILPSDDIVAPTDNQTVALQLRAYDPLQRRFEAPAKPQRLGVQHLGDEAELLAAARPAEDGGGKIWTVQHGVQRPGDYTFFVEYPPRWDAAEEQFVVTAAKLCVHRLGLEEGWDEPVGIEAEIVPMTRPYGLATGTLFSGQVLLNGDPVPYALVEIVALGPTPGTPPPGPAPAQPYLVQKVRADAGGVFHAAMPRQGWWGFTAIVDAERSLRHDNAEMPVTVVTSYWVLVRDP